MQATSNPHFSAGCSASWKTMTRSSRHQSTWLRSRPELVSEALLGPLPRRFGSKDGPRGPSNHSGSHCVPGISCLRMRGAERPSARRCAVIVVRLPRPPSSSLTFDCPIFRPWRRNAATACSTSWSVTPGRPRRRAGSFFFIDDLSVPTHVSLNVCSHRPAATTRMNFVPGFACPPGGK